MQAKAEIAGINVQEKLAWLRLARTENVGPVTFHRLLQTYGGAEAALEVLPELSRRGGRAKPLKAPSPGDILHEYERLKNIGGDIVTAACPLYSLALGAIDDAPPVLSYIGNPAMMQQSCVAVVGARNASLNSKKFAHKLAQDLGRQRQIVVSGLARGIDTAAHEGALESGTIAVVAGGIDIVYPEENKALHEKIAAQGLVLAESALGQQPFAQSFPRRNRIVSGLSKGVVVVEATMRSGSLITARLAGEQGRDVYAVPGHPMDPRAEGPNHLIREGATLVRGAGDILECLMNFGKTTLREITPPPGNLDPPVLKTLENPEILAARVMEHLSYTPVSVDELIRACHVSTQEVQTVLLDLELAGRVKRLPGNKVSLLEGNA